MVVSLRMWSVPMSVGRCYNDDIWPFVCMLRLRQCPCCKIDYQYCHITGEHQCTQGEHKEHFLINSYLVPTDIIKTTSKECVTLSVAYFPHISVGCSITLCSSIWCLFQVVIYRWQSGAHVTSWSLTWVGMCESLYCAQLFILCAGWTQHVYKINIYSKKAVLFKTHSCELWILSHLKDDLQLLPGGPNEHDQPCTQQDVLMDLHQHMHRGIFGGSWVLETPFWNCNFI